MIIKTPPPPYYAVIFVSFQTNDTDGYSDISKKLSEIAKNQDGCYGEESVRDGMGISISYWKDLESIRKWKENLDHQFAMKMGKEKWYSSYKVRIAKVERDYGFNKPL
ncbi:MAG TPA: antibiotic biosynthesis monooxygenase [Bacteroidetes bacterium]|nr:antibiotic biosynthesis monooxygenase [Bacteroidota bacterium]